MHKRFNNSYFVLFIYLILLLFIFGKNLNDFFLSDDFIFIKRVSLNNLTTGEFFRPISAFFNWVNYKIWDLNPFGYHAFNVILHLINAFLIYRILQYWNKNFRSIQNNIPFFAGLLFLVWHTHSESVVWISGIGSILAVFFILLSSLTYLKFIHTDKFFYILLCATCYFLALAAYQSILFYPILLIFISHQQGLSEKFNYKLGVFYLLFLGLLHFILKYLSIGVIIGGYGNNIHISLPVLKILRNLIAFPARLLVFPFQEKVVPILVASLLIIIAIVYLRINFKYLLSIGTLLFFALLPVLNLGIHLHNTEGERFLYFPVVIVAIAIPILLSKLKSVKFNLLIILILIYNITILHFNTVRWDKGSTLAYNLLDSACENPALEPIDNFKGVYIYRNGWVEAKDLFCKFP